MCFLLCLIIFGILKKIACFYCLMSIENPTNFVPEIKLPLIIQKVANVYGIPINSSVLRDLTVISTACGIADDELDRCKDPNKRKKIYLDFLDYLFGNKQELENTGSVTFPAFEESMRYLKELIGELAPYKREQLRSNLRVWSRLSEQRRSDKSLPHSISVRLSDLDLTTLVYLSVVPEEVKNGNWNEFLYCVQKMVRTAGMIDDLFDLEEDIKGSVVALDAKLTTKKSFVVHSIKEALSVLNLRIFKHLFLDSVLIMYREYRRRRFDCTDQYKLRPNT